VNPQLIPSPILIALPTLILLSPLLGILALLVRVKLGSPVLFRQQRPGLRSTSFTLVKFRTMTDGIHVLSAQPRCKIGIDAVC
jgi:lipopolysaccharide/colanic/teichoic acid biosynthesis glycosyltransferase